MPTLQNPPIGRMLGTVVRGEISFIVAIETWKYFTEDTKFSPSGSTLFWMYFFAQIFIAFRLAHKYRLQLFGRVIRWNGFFEPDAEKCRRGTIIFPIFGVMGLLFGLISLAN